MGGVGLIIAAVVAYVVFWATTKERTRWWREAVERAGLTGVESSTFLGCTTGFTGRSGSLTVTLGTYRRGRHELGTRISIGGFRHGAWALTIRPEGFTSAIEKTFGERELEVGDPAFDSLAYLQGAPSLVRAIFDWDTRRQMQPLLGGELPVAATAGKKALKVRTSLTNDVLQVDIQSGMVNSTDAWIPAALAVLLELGHRLERPDDLAARIADNASREPFGGVRLADLRTLAAEFPKHPASRDALAAALGDDDVDVCLFAAAALGPEGRGKLLELATAEAPDRVAAAAVTALGDHFPSELAIDRLRRAQSSREGATAMACIGAVGRAGTPAGIAALADLLGSAASDLAAAAARALGTAASAEQFGAAESALVVALRHDASEVRVAAAEALGRVGTPLAVAPLREATSGRALDGALRRATRQAIAEIQGRVSGASPGQLSLAADGVGQVTLAEADRSGQVSLEGVGVTGGEDERAAASREADPEADREAARRRALGADAARQSGTIGRR